MNIQQLKSSMIELGATYSGIVDVKDIKFSKAFRASCEMNACGKYGTNWMCPPGVGELEDLIKQVREFKTGVVFQTVCTLEDSFDFEGMEAASDTHLENFNRIQQYINENTEPEERTFRLNAGQCKVCKDCTYPDGKPCRFPGKAVASLESYGINVASLAEACGLNYINGQNTVTYVGMFLF